MEQYNSAELYAVLNLYQNEKIKFDSLINIMLQSWNFLSYQFSDCYLLNLRFNSNIKRYTKLKVIRKIWCIRLYCKGRRV